MYKFLGTVMIIGSTIGIFLIPIIEKQRRISVLFELLTLMRHAYHELQTNMCSIPELISILSEKGSTTKDLFNKIMDRINDFGSAEFENAWKENFLILEGYLSWDEIKSLNTLGEIWGQYSLNDQLSVTSEVIKLLEANYNNVRLEYKTFAKTNWGLGLSFSAIIAILFI